MERLGNVLIALGAVIAIGGLVVTVTGGDNGEVAGDADVANSDDGASDGAISDERASGEQGAPDGDDATDGAAEPDAPQMTAVEPPDTVIGGDNSTDEPTPTADASPAPPPSDAAEPESFEDFYEVFDEALAAQDVEFLYDRLAPAVIERYGADQCRTYLDSLPPQDLDLTIVDVAGPAAWEWTTDDVVTTVPDTYTVTLERTVDGETSEIEAHVVRDDLVRWFTDCGDPL